MRSIPFLLILVLVIACSSFRDKFRFPQSTPEANLTVAEKTPTPELVEPPPAPSVDKNARTVSGGILNDKAISLPKPAYPAAARAVRATGKVSVQVTIDTSGSVESAKAVSGHPLLQAAAAAAARAAKFSPTLLGGKPVKVTGIIVYDFAESELFIK